MFGSSLNDALTLKDAMKKIYILGCALSGLVGSLFVINSHLLSVPEVIIGVIGTSILNGLLGYASNSANHKKSKKTVNET